MKLGIIQGRLSQPVENHIQEFPIDNWEKEFESLNLLGLSHIEWIVTKNSLDDNPILSKNLTTLSISSICCDHIIDEKIQNYSFLYNNLYPICESAIKNNIKFVSIPLLEDSNMESSKRRNEFIKSILKIKNKFNELSFIFETELQPEKTLEIVNTNNDFYVTYDTGNITSYLRQHEKYVNLLKNKIINVHLKDRTFDAKTVLPFTGDTKFDSIFNLLKDINYGGIYTLQIARGETGKEQEHIEYFIKKFKELHAQYFI